MVVVVKRYSSASNQGDDPRMKLNVNKQIKRANARLIQTESYESSPKFDISHFQRKKMHTPCMRAYVATTSEHIRMLLTVPSIAFLKLVF